MSKTKRITVAVLVLSVALLIGWDLVVICNETPGDTISEMLYSAARRWPIIPLCVGMILGHIFWAQK